MEQKRAFYEVVLRAVENILEDSSRTDTLSQLPPKILKLANSIATQIKDEQAKFVSPNDIYRSESETSSISREPSMEDLTDSQKTKICNVAGNLSGKTYPLDQIEEALESLRSMGFEVHVFAHTTVAKSDPRLNEPPDDWFFKQVADGKLSRNAVTIPDAVMICEVREKPDVIDDTLWVQLPYPNDPFVQEMEEAHREVGRNNVAGGKIMPTSRAGFTFYQLEEVVLPKLSEKAGITVRCMPQMYASILANTHPEIGNGRSTEWRSDEVGTTHVVISGRSVRGPVKHVYYDHKGDPYHNRGFRVYMIL